MDVQKEAIQRLEEACVRMFESLRRSAGEEQARDAGAIEYDSWAAAIEYDSWSHPLGAK